MDEFSKAMKWGFSEIQGTNAYSMDRNRPYDGQPHTGLGKRGGTHVEGLTMRDVSDCIVKAFLECGGIYRENPIWDDVYSIEEDLDYIAVAQCALCNIEKMMGIYPNVPELEISEECEDNE